MVAGTATAAAHSPRVKAKPSRSFPTAYRRLPFSRKLEWLGGEECASFVKAGTLQFNQVEAEARRLEKQRVRVLQTVPSLTWIEDWQRGAAFPPPAEHTPMELAGRMLCKAEITVLWPAIYLQGGETFDVKVFQDLMRRAHIEGKCDLNAGTTESPTRVVLDVMEKHNKALTRRKLPTEDTSVLQLQIAAFNAGRPTTILTDDR